MLHNKMPPFYSNSGLMLQLFNVEDLEIQRFQNELGYTANQYFVDTANIALDEWEKEVGLPKSMLPNAQRRSAIKSKLRGYGTVTVTHIKTVCDAYTNGDVNVIEKPNTYEFEIKFNSVRGIPPNINDLKNIIEQIKPAHLGVTYVYSYLIWDEWDSYNKTWDEIDSLNLTWGELEIYKEVI